MNQEFAQFGFLPAHMLLPQKTTDMTKWSVIACDQFTSEPDYWDEVSAFVGSAPSTLNMILPERYLEEPDVTQKINHIHNCMIDYQREGLLAPLPEGFIYLKRTLPNGRIRKGLIGVIDLECYDYARGTTPLIRATEGTVLDRIPPRMAIRSNASLELPHIMLLMDDPFDQVMQAAEAETYQSDPLYDFMLMMNGGKETGYLITSDYSGGIYNALLALYEKSLDRAAVCNAENPMLFAVGDGNHSLAAAKANWMKIKETLTCDQIADHAARYALVELVNLHDSSLEFEPIHRVYFGCNPDKVLAALNVYYPQAALKKEKSQKIIYYTGHIEGTVCLPDLPGHLIVETLQTFLDDYISAFEGKLDYIHGDETLKQLSAAPNTIGFRLPDFPKENLFTEVFQNGSLPRKTFSMGEANEKRYYLEARRII